jgi:hypothetical protein
VSGEEAAAAVQRALAACMGPGAAEQLALAQARLAWDETLAAAGLARPGMSSRLLTVRSGVAHVEATEPILAQELRLRAGPLLVALNERMLGRPGATIVLRGLNVSVGRSRGSVNL